MKNNKVKINKMFLLFVVFFFCITLGKLFYITYSEEVDGENLKQYAKNRRTVNKILPSQRGTIFDINGEALAKNARSYTVIAYLHKDRTTDMKNPKHVINKDKTARLLSPIINMSEQSILNLLNQNLNTKNLYQVELGPGGRNISELTKEEIENLGLPGIDFVKTTKRDYPYGDFASYIIGYSKKDSNDILQGEMGIEMMYDVDLNGVDGSTTYEKDAYGYQLANSDSIKIDPVDGKDIYLTIDSNIQLHIENAMLKLAEYGMDWGTLTIADAKTGAIVGNTSYPSFNPNVLEIKNYNNPLTSYAYEPGSTMKIFSYMAALDHNKYDETKKVNTGYMEVDGFKISDWYEDGWGKIDYDTGFGYSSNLVAARLGELVGKKDLLEYYKKLGFSSKTGIELGHENTGVINFKYKTELISASFGQGITTTPIQNIKALTTITNEGELLKPYIIDKIVDNGKVVYKGKKTTLAKVSTKQTTDKIISLMDKVVNEDKPYNTGKAFRSDKINIVGKTGTAEYSDGSGKYKKGTYYNIRSFAGIFPKEDPQYIIFLSLKDFIGGSPQIGDAVVSFVESVAKYKNLLTENEPPTSKIVNVKNYINQERKKTNKNCLDSVYLGDGEIIIDQFPIEGTKVLCGSKLFLKTNSTKYLMPNITNYKISEIITLANMFNLKYSINGYGGKISTSIKENEDITKINKIEISLGDDYEKE